MKSRETTALEESLGYRFQRPELLDQALTHSSQAREVEALGGGGAAAVVGSFRGDNEILEFLGDAVLGLVTSEALFHRFPQFQEGHLSKLRAHLVGQRHLLHVAEHLQIGRYMRLGRGEEKSGGRNKASLLVDSLEAILAALYLDGGWTVARDFILREIVEPELGHMKLETSAIPVMDFKSALQEALQARGGPQPVYALVKEEGPEHKKTFTVEVRLPEPEIGLPAIGQFVSRAQGATKKRAEQEAARQALEHLTNLTQAERAGDGKIGGGT
jgi:ribonuclease-3